jgi:hypothetical protein
MIIERAIIATSRALSRRRISRTIVIVLFATLLQVISGSFTTASATGTPTVTMPTGGWVINQSETTTISGASVSGLSAGSTYLITISLTGSTNGAKLKLSVTSGITASYGYTSGANTLPSFTKISFTGLETDVNNALAGLQYMAATAATSGTTPTISISAVENISGLAYNPANNHYYKAVKYTDSVKPSDNAHSTAMTWTQTQSFAGLNGYLVTITSSDENSFVASTIPNASNIWIGARDNWTGGGYTFGEGYWGWASPGSPEYGAGFSYDSTASSGVTIDGSTKRFVSTGRTNTGSYTGTNTGITMVGANGGNSNGYFNWCSSEPNNVNGEHMAVTNWGGDTCWNDLPDSYSSVQGLVIEWGTNAADGGFTNAVTSSAKVYVAPTLSRVSGNNQIAPVSTTLSDTISVRFSDAMGTVIPNATISWSVTRGTRVGATSTTSAGGIGTLGSWTMPATSGYDTLTASYSGAGNPSITFNARVTDYQLSNLDTDTALSLNGTSQYAIASSSTVLPTAWNSPFTLEAWAYPTTSNSVSIIYSQGTGSTRFYVKRYNGSLVWYRDGWTLSGGEQTCGNLPSNEWAHVALSFSGSSAICYINGEATLTSAVSNNGTVSLNAPSVIGQYSASLSDVNSYWVGALDEVKIWSTVRSQSNVQLDMNSRTSPTTSGLLAYYDFNEGVGSVLYNQTRDSTTATAPIDFTLVGSPTWNANLIASTSTTAPYTTTTFKRTYITVNGGWKVPGGSRTVSALTVGGGGGGGWNSGSGGGGGAFLLTSPLQISGTVTVKVGTGGRGGQGARLGSSSPAVPTYDPTSGLSSQFASYSVSGGSRGSVYNVSCTGCGDGIGTATGTSGSGGAGAPSSGTDGYGGGAGYSSSISGSAQIYSAGGGGGGWVSNGGAPGGATTGTRGGGSPSVPGSGGSNSPNDKGISASPNTGSGGGASAAYVDAGNGGSGVIIVRWITASVPSYTKPTNAYLNVGMTETFTTLVSADSATVGLTRTFRWESSTTGVNGTYSLIKQGTGAANAAFSWVPSDTSTSGSTYTYRVIVTDSDTAGLFIVDTSTPVWAIINKTLVVTGNSIIKKAINVSRNETFTITFGTSTYRPTLSPVITGVTLDTSTAGSAVVKISDTATVGTYYETLTVTDSVSASVVIPLTITISAPPNLLNTAEIVSNDLVLNLDAGNSASLIGESGTVTSGSAWNDLSGSKFNGATGAGVNTGANGGTSCTAPTYSSANAGSLTFSAGSNNCYYVASLNPTTIRNNYTVEVWFKTSTTLPSNTGILSQSLLAINAPYFLSIGTFNGSALYVSFWDNTSAASRYANCGYTPTIGVWTHIAGTYDGTTMSTYINGQLLCSTPITPYSPSGSANNSGIIIGNVGNGSTAGTFPGSIASVRIYKSALSSTQLLGNFNSTKSRFDDSNISTVTPSKKYGSLLLDSFTATSGSDTRTLTITTGNRSGILWDTTTVTNQVRLTMQESLTVGTYYDTATVTDNLGQSTYLPIKMIISKADTITVTSGPSLTTVYNGLAPTNGPVVRITGLVGFDTATVSTTYTSGAGSTCATGGSCSIGDIGPGGGYVFYISGSVIDSATGISDGGTYLEVAPKGWSTPGSEYQGQWAAAFTSVTGTSRSVGQGAENTRKIIAALSSTTNLAKVTADLTYGGKSDWFFPSSDEVKSMYTNLYAASKGDFSASNYWASTQDDLNSQTARADTYWFGAGNDYSPTSKTNSFYLRPIRAFSPSSVTTNSTPADVDTYTVSGANLNFSVGNISNYQSVVYETSTLVITQANQNKLSLNLYGAVAGSPFTLLTAGGSGDGAVTETVTAGSTATNCAVSNHVLTNSNSASEQIYCNVIVTKASSRNYKSESLTASVYFMVYINSQPTGQVGSGNGIGLNGITSFDTSTVLPPSITGFSTLTLSLGTGGTFTITGTGFTGSITVKFWRNKSLAATSGNGTSIAIPVSSIQSAGATSGRIAVITSTGEAISIDSLTITP